MTPDPYAEKNKTKLSAAREVLESAAGPMSDEMFVGALRRYAESAHWAVLVTAAGPAVRLVLARRDRLVLVGVGETAKFTPTQHDLLAAFGNAGAETYVFERPYDLEAAEGVLG